MDYRVVLILFLAIVRVNAQFGQGTIFQILNNTKGLQKFASWCSEVEHLYTGQGHVTVFAFNDSSFDRLPSQERQVLEQLDAQGRSEYVRSFTVKNKYVIFKLYDDQVLTSLQGTRLFVDKKTITPSSLTGTTRTFINGEMIVREDLHASNGIIHVLERAPLPASPKNVFEMLSNPDTSTVGNTTIWQSLMTRLIPDYFAAAIAPLSSENTVTLFLPSDEALEKVPEARLNALPEMRLAEYFQMHFIPKFAVYTSVVDGTYSFTSGTSRTRISFTKTEGKVLVSSGGVTAQITRGDITVDNGVIHIIDRMLGNVYNTAVEQIAEDAGNFSSLLEGISSQTQQLVTQPTGVNMFVPLDEAFDYVRGLSGIDIHGNQTLKEMVVRLSMIKDGGLAVTQLGEGGYESRQRRISYYDNTKLVIYKDRNETWVNGGNMRAKIIRPDVGVTNGRLQYIDRLLGIPTMDIPTLIHNDDYLLRTYHELQRVHLDEYLEDPLFNKSATPPRNIDPNVYPSNQSSNNQSQQDQKYWCDTTCGDGASGCQFTFFVPNGSAIENYQKADYSRNILNDSCRYRFIFRRLLIPHRVISLENLNIGPPGLTVQTDTGENITIQKESENDVRILWKDQSSSAIMWDLGATNGIVHIVDKILSDSDDQHLNVFPTTSSTTSTSESSTVSIAPTSRTIEMETVSSAPTSRTTETDTMSSAHTSKTTDINTISVAPTVTPKTYLCVFVLLLFQFF